MCKHLKPTLLPLLIIATFAFIGYMSYEKYKGTQVAPTYTLEEVLQHTHKEKNKPLVIELFRLGDIARDSLHLKRSEIADKETRHARTLLNRICKDTCKAIRCRIDPGLGHACRINCPGAKLTPCKMAVQSLKNEKNR